MQHDVNGMGSFFPGKGRGAGFEDAGDGEMPDVVFGVAEVEVRT
jgi:hypothetical protein